jgi:hypothetical protein
MLCFAGLLLEPITGFVTNNQISFTKTPQFKVFFVWKIIFGCLEKVNTCMENTTQPQPQTQIDVTITDLFLIRGILDVAIQRGTFRGDELVQIGEVYTKLMNFLNMISSQAQQAQQEANQTESDQPPPNHDSLQGE